MNGFHWNFAQTRKTAQGPTTQILATNWPGFQNPDSGNFG